jgi:PUB domain/UBX domain
MVNTRELLLRIGKENDLPIARIEELIKKLEDEWYSDTNSLKEINDQQWKALGIPIRIVGLIKKYLNEDPKLISESRKSVLSRLVGSLSSNIQDLTNCISILQKIVYNIVTNPIPRYRVLKLSNLKFNQAVGRLSLGQEYLKLIGFVLNNGEFTMAAINSDVLSESLSELNGVADTLGIPLLLEPEKFNPFKSSLSCTNFGAPKLNTGENDPIAITEEINNIKRQRFEVLKKISIKRNPKLYKITQGFNSNIDEEPLPDLDEEIMRKNIQSIIIQRENSMNFQNKRKNQLEKLRGKEFIAQVTIKIRFVNGYVAQGNFSVNETTKDIYEFVQSSIVSDQKFYLFSSPPKQVLKPGDEKLVNFAPAAAFQFAWSDDSNAEIRFRLHPQA